MIVLFFISKKLIVCVTDFDRNLLLYWPFVGDGSILYQWQDWLCKMLCHISFFVYTFCRLLWFSQIWIWPFRTFKTYIVIIKSQQKYSNFVYFGNCLKISVSIGTSLVQNADRRWLLLKADHSFSKPKSFIHKICSVLSPIFTSLTTNTILW